MDGFGVGTGDGQPPGEQDGLGAGRVGPGDTVVAGAEVRVVLDGVASSGNFGVPNLLLLLSRRIAAVAATMNCRQMGPG